jgi:tRNA(adenine34) deaminase
MCAGACSWAQLGELHYAASDPIRGFMQISTKLLHPKTKVSGGLMGQEAKQLLDDFFDKLRN